MKESDLIETIRSLLRPDEMKERHSASYSAPDGLTVPADEFSGEWSDGFPVPAERDGELRDVLIELNVTTHEYIRMALQHHGGRLRQQEIADLTGWSEPTVSQKLGEMEDDGHITRFRTGREKIVCLPDDSPVDATQQAGDAEGSSVEPGSTSGAPDGPPGDQTGTPPDADGAPADTDRAYPDTDGAPPDVNGTPENPDPPSQ